MTPGKPIYKAIYRGPITLSITTGPSCSTVQRLTAHISAAKLTTSLRWQETGDTQDAMWSCSQSIGLISVKLRMFTGTVDGRNPANQLSLAAYLIIYRVLYIPGGAGFQPSTVCHDFLILEELPLPITQFLGSCLANFAIWSLVFAGSMQWIGGSVYHLFQVCLSLLIVPSLKEKQFAPEDFWLVQIRFISFWGLLRPIFRGELFVFRRSFPYVPIFKTKKWPLRRHPNLQGTPEATDGNRGVTKQQGLAAFI